MNIYRRLFTIFSIVLLTLLSACSGASTIPSSWPGLSAGKGVAYLAYQTQVYAINASTGVQLWSYPTEPDNRIQFYADPVLSPDGQLIVGGYHHVLYSLNPETGQLNWQFQQAKNRYVGSPLVTEKGIYAPNADKTLYALDASGALLWTFETKGEIWGRPIASADGFSIYLPSLDHTVYAIDANDGSLIWSTGDLGGAVIGTPALGEDGTLYLGTLGSEVIALDSTDGTVRWRVSTEGWVWSGIALAEGRLYFGDLNGNLYALQAADGNRVWQIKSEQLDGPIVAAPLVHQGRLYVVTESGTLYAVDLEGRVQWSQTLGGKLYTTPALVDDVLLISPMNSEEILIALTMEGVRKWSFAPKK